MKRLQALMLGGVLACGMAASAGAESGAVEYKLLATSKTSTMEKELNQAAGEGFRFEGVMGGDTAFGGKEVVSILGRAVGDSTARYEYKLLATNKTGTMQKEMAEAASNGFVYKGQTISDTLFGGREVLVIMERERGASAAVVEYKLLATNKTSTMQKELSGVAASGFRYRGVTVASTAFGGNEVVVITERGVGAR